MTLRSPKQWSCGLSICTKNGLWVPTAATAFRPAKLDRKHREAGTPTITTATYVPQGIDWP